MNTERLVQFDKGNFNYLKLKIRENKSDLNTELNNVILRCRKTDKMLRRTLNIIQETDADGCP